MAQVQSMLQSHPNPANLDGAALSECIEACMQCAQACTACADACLSEQQVANLRRCIRLDLDCADICTVTGAILSRQTDTPREIVRQQVQTLAAACEACAAECDQHASMHEHCKTCAEACRRCAQSCNSLLGAMPAAA
jgi:hypothetical protein